MKGKIEQVVLPIGLLVLTILFNSCGNKRENTISNKEYYFYEEELQKEYFKKFYPKEYEELFPDKEDKKAIKLIGTGNEPLYLSDEYTPFRIEPREINMGKPLIDVRIKDDSTVICVYIEINKDIYTYEDIEKIRANYHNNKKAK